METECLVVGPLETNCYIVTSEKPGKCVVIDPGDEKETLVNRFEALSVEPEAILLTHAHPDHVMAVEGLKTAYDCPVYLHRSDIDLLADRGLTFLLAMGSGAGFQPDRFLTDGEFLKFESASFKVIHTPGHTRGSVCFLAGDSLFTGDLLFQNGIGRCDLPGGSESQVLESLRKVLLLGDSTRVYPGHGPSTTIGAERRGNYYVINFLK